MDLKKDFKILQENTELGNKVCFEEIDNLINVLESRRSHLLEEGSTFQKELGSETSNMEKKILEYNKHTVLSIHNFGKVVSNKFKMNLSLANGEEFLGQAQVLKEIVIQHFIRQGQFELARQFSEEANINFPCELKAKFEGMYSILNEIKKHELGPAINWARLHSIQLAKNGSNLEFNLHRLNFILHLTLKSPYDALKYAQENFSAFNSSHFAEIKRLMGLLTYGSRPSHSPYSDLIGSTHWPDIHYMFARDFCSVLGLSHESPLYVSVTVGTGALPVLIKMTQVMLKSKSEWSQSQELPVEIQLMDAHRFHSIFVCPVSKEQASDTNSPMMMPCGHVICNDALGRLSRGPHRFKCPYCPSESLPSQSIKIQF